MIVASGPNGLVRAPKNVVVVGAVRALENVSSKHVERKRNEHATLMPALPGRISFSTMPNSTSSSRDVVWG